MQNSFGLKDFVLLVLLIVVIVSVWFAMVQEDRRWGNIREMQSQVGRLEQQVALLQRAVEQAPAAFVPALPDGGGQVSQGQLRDETWARDGAPITWQSAVSFVNDPRDHPEFAVGGRFTEIFEAQLAKITPLLYYDVYGRRVNDLVVEPLGRYNPETLELEGVLAEAWQYDPNGMWLRVKIQPRARFSDGQPVTAEDVKFTYDMIFDHEIEAERFRNAFNTIASAKVIRTDVIEFTFTEPMFLNLEAGLGMYALPKHFYENFTPSQFNQSTGLLMGSGPFRLRTLDPDAQWTPGNDVVLVRNEQYWGPKPALDEVRFTVVDDDLSRLVAYEQERGDMMRPTARQFVANRDKPGWSEKHRAMAWTNIRSGYSFIAWQTGPRNGRLTPFHDKRVRQAMTHLLDRWRIIRDIYEGVGEVCNGPFSPDTPQANPEIEPWPYNIDRAKELLAEAGWRDRGDGLLKNERGDVFTFEYTFSSGNESGQRLANYLRDQCARVGIRVELRTLDWSVYRDALNNRDFDAITLAWSPGAAEQDPYGLWHTDSMPTGGNNFVQWNTPRSDELIEMGRRELDPEKRMAIWHELHEIIHDEQPYTFLLNAPWLRFVNRRIENVHPYRTGVEYGEFIVPQ